MSSTPLDRQARFRILVYPDFPEAFCPQTTVRFDPNVTVWFAARLFTP